ASRDGCSSAVSPLEPQKQTPSWPGLSRPSTISFVRRIQNVDARHKAGHDEANAPSISSNIQLVGLGELGVLLDELETRLGLVAHQPLDQIARAPVVVLCDLDPEQGACGGVHGRLLKLLRQHLAEP